MIDNTDLLSLETNIRDLVGEETAKLWTQASVFRAINSEVMRLVRKVIDIDAGYFEAVYTPTVAATITLPVNCYVVRTVEVYDGATWQTVPWIDSRTKQDYQLSTYAGAVRFVDGTVVFEGGVTGVSSVKIYYCRVPASMKYCTLTGGSATTAVLPDGSALDDVYIGDRFIVLGGTGVGQVSTITDYVASTLTCTIASGATLDATTVVSWLLPEPLAKWPDLVATGAAMRLLNRRRDNELIASLAQQYTLDLEDMTNVLEQRQTQEPQHGNFVSPGDE